MIEESETVNSKGHRYLQSINLNSDNWLISKKTSEEWLIVHKYCGRTRVVPAP